MKTLQWLLWMNIPNHFLCNDNEEPEEQVKKNLVENEEAIKIPAENDGLIEMIWQRWNIS